MEGEDGIQEGSWSCQPTGGGWSSKTAGGEVKGSGNDKGGRDLGEMLKKESRIFSDL